MLKAVLLILGVAGAALCQNATMSGLVRDPSDAVIPSATVTLVNQNTGAKKETATNGEGYYTVVSLSPGAYQVLVQKNGFRASRRDDVTLEVAQNARLDFTLLVGNTAETLEVTADAPLLNTQDASVSTVVGREFVENMPLNGRSFQSLFQSTPGFVTTKATAGEAGQFSVSGQRASANYITIDGTGANAGVGNQAATGIGQSSSGALPGFSTLGSTNTLVSVDALQEFRIQTSTYAPEYGRTAGAQISLATRSGANQFHGTLFDYFRNDKMDANDWFNDANSLRKAGERQNDFGGVVGGPVIKNHTFFFFSYEGLRLRQPQTVVNDVPSLDVRKAAPAAIQPYLNAYPLPTGPATTNGFAVFAASFSNPSSIDATSLRIDHMIGSKLTLFGRYNHSPSESDARGGGTAAASTITVDRSVTDSMTAGATYTLTATLNNDLRFNWSKVSRPNFYIQDTFGGAQLLDPSIVFPPGENLSHSDFGIFVSSNGGVVQIGTNTTNLQEQLNLVEGLSWTVGAHHLKFGADYRRLFPTLKPNDYYEGVKFANAAATIAGIPQFIQIKGSGLSRKPVFNNYSAYAQDTWNVTSRMTLTYGVRWDYNPPPFETSGNPPLVLTGLDSPATVTPLPYGSPLWTPARFNFAPRLGIAYRAGKDSAHEFVIRGGTGIFYDLGTGNAAGVFSVTPPYEGSVLLRNVQFPLSSAQAALPPGGRNGPFDYDSVPSFDPHLKLPYTLQYNVALEKALGTSQIVTATYVGSIGRRLLRADGMIDPNPNFIEVDVTRNRASSSYNSLQLQYQRRLFQGLQVLAAYTWSHSIDNGSNDSSIVSPIYNSNPDADRGSSDFDLRHVGNLTVSYDIPRLHSNRILRAALNNWGTDAIFNSRSATPITPSTQYSPEVNTFLLRPSLAAGIPVYLNDPHAPGGMKLNPAAFVPATTQNGTLGRNVLRGFRMNQLDMAVRRQFRVTERIKMQFRAELFNIFNHPNFAPPITNLSSGQFGLSTQMLGPSLGSVGHSGLNSLYQIGGPRSVQLALKLTF